MSEDITDRLRCRYAMGPIMPDGEPEFGWRDFGGPAPEGVMLPTPVMLEAAEVIEAKDAEIARLNAIINTPQSGDFLRAVSTEGEHQRQRWGSNGDAGKTPADWFWLVGYLAGKALHAHASGNTEKAEHYIITTAAACLNWHAAMFGKTDMRPGIDATSAKQGGQS